MVCPLNVPPPQKKIFNNYVGFDVWLFSNIFVVGIKKCQLRVSQRIVGSQNLYRDEKTIIYYKNQHIECLIP